ncbi:MAG: hypothetical protein M3Y53_00690 [Thermoproteota archaeon]|nr:hypothetical protein [Thermoproteota archaeon]
MVYKSLIAYPIIAWAMRSLHQWNNNNNRKHFSAGTERDVNNILVLNSDW